MFPPRELCFSGTFRLSSVLRSFPAGVIFFRCGQGGDAICFFFQMWSGGHVCLGLGWEGQVRSNDVWGLAGCLGGRAVVFLRLLPIGLWVQGGVGTGPMFDLCVPAGLMFNYKRVGGLSDRGLPKGGTLIIVSSKASVQGCKCLREMLTRLELGGMRALICSGVLPGPVGRRIVRTTTVYQRRGYSFMMKLKNKDSVSSTGDVTIVTYGSNSC